MKTIWKYQLITPNESIFVPASAEVLSFQFQNGTACVWVLVEPSNDLIRRDFRVYGTGMPIQDKPMVYYGTAQDGEYVWHLFELIN